jgi:hypothetical protein
MRLSVFIKNKEDMYNKYDYQYGYCHYFADIIIDKIRELVPSHVPVNYYLILGERFDDDDESIDDVLIHAYIKIKDFYIDSEGIHTIDHVNKREQEWIDVEETLTPDGYSFDTWQEETDEIPQYFFNRFCKRSHVEKDIKDFLSQPIIKQFISKLQERQ